MLPRIQVGVCPVCSARRMQLSTTIGRFPFSHWCGVIGIISCIPKAASSHVIFDRECVVGQISVSHLACLLNKLVIVLHFQICLLRSRTQTLWGKSSRAAVQCRWIGNRDASSLHFTGLPSHFWGLDGSTCYKLQIDAKSQWLRAEVRGHYVQFEVQPRQ
jgi:hypothetical protein